ncbi:3'(2'),5'-bisphosphate nucleotidase CysQ [Magnetofaba australis]|uniref:Putative inositol monophosphatase n=1 Tax=Magnetofaba australis IT-1 TaxID=1434232 RepID=A0A1Y2K869_9PROT|nr:3'(2'),5'-bisphosphate nucleotidase CysQ [Magnetofaba australis]OSM06829.1 putative inositol monophosphatase [Magnetofaba australis IT-1]
MSLPELPIMLQAARECGLLAMKYFRHGETVAADANVQHKGADDPLTQADLEIDRHLHEVLLSARPDYGWLSEETVDDPARMQRRRIWVVDPIDGTKEFIQGLPQFAISIGLVEDGKPIAGVVYNPAAEEMFSASIHDAPLLNGQPMACSARAELVGASCLASRSETKRGEWDGFKDEFRLELMGSIAYKLALVACGRNDITFTLTPKSEWDICAGVALVQAAGGSVTRKDGSEFIFNEPDPRTRSVLAAPNQLHTPLLQRLVDTPLSPDRRGGTPPPR